MKLRAWLFALGLATLPVASASLTAHAQEEGAETSAEVDPGEDRATAFRAVSGSEAESVPGGTLLVSAYAVIWVALLLYVLRLSSLQAQARADLDRLERSLGASASDD